MQKLFALVLAFELALSHVTCPLSHVTCTLSLVPLAFAEDLTSSNFILRNPTVDNSGGGWSDATSFQSFDILGAPVIDRSTSASFENQSGFGYVQDPVFTLSAPANISYSTLAVSTATQVANATLANIDVVNTRGVATAWSITINVTNITKRGTSSTVAGDNNTVNFTGTYTGVTAPHTYGKYTVEITTGGAVGAAIFKWTDPAETETTGITTAASVALNNGITVNFDPATYAIGDKWILRVDSMGYTNLTITPGAITTNFGNANVDAGASGTFSGTGITSNARTLISAASGNGEGGYTQTPALSQSVHANTLNGEFNGTITLTIS